jgi:hypothetical protein
MNDEQKKATIGFAEVVEEVARRLRQPNPDSKIIELAAQDLEEMARNLRRSAA